MAKPTTWETYEQVAAYLLGRTKDHFGLSSIEPKQKLGGTSGADWEIDAKGVRGADEAIIIIECRRYPTRAINQEAIAGLAFRINDINAAGAILVSPLGLQEGASKVAKSSGIIEVTLSADATPESFKMQFLDQVMVGVRGLQAQVKLGVPKATGNTPP